MLTSFETFVQPSSKKNPFPAKLLERTRLTDRTSEKETFHVVLDLEGSDIHYQAGDSLGVYPTNDHQSVGQLIAELGFSGIEPVVLPKTETSITLREALLHHYLLKEPTPKFLNFLLDYIANPGQKSKLEELLAEGNKDQCLAFLECRDYLDLAVLFPSTSFTAQDYINNLKKLQPRLYSIASSPLEHPTQVHLTVAAVRYESLGRPRHGVASTYLIDRVLQLEESVPVFLSPSKFKLPQNPAQPVIMIGPGTGVAPFRAFLQECSASPRTNPTWLFFGERRRARDFLYQEDWEQFLADGTLTKLSLAFSRDQEAKFYVQDAIQQDTDTFWQWIEQGASIYLCGDAKHMAKDVEATLLAIASSKLAISDLDAASWLKDLKRAGRYHKDVY